MFTPLDFIGLGPTELVILLVILVILFAGARQPKLLRGSLEQFHNFRMNQFLAELRKDHVWQFNDGRQRLFDGPPKTTPQWLLWLALTGGGFLLVLSAYLASELSVKQTLVALGVFAAAGLTGWLCIGKERK